MLSSEKPEFRKSAQFRKMLSSEKPDFRDGAQFRKISLWKRSLLIDFPVLTRVEIRSNNDLLIQSPNLEQAGVLLSPVESDETRGHYNPGICPTQLHL